MTPLRRAAPRVAAGSAVALVLAACGLPGDAPARRVDDGTVPYRLLDGADTPPTSPPEERPPGPAPLVFWLVGDRLVPSATETDCTEDPEVVVRLLLEELVAGPSEDERDASRSTALPPESGLALVGLEDGTAQIEVDTVTSISADRLPVAVGQVVLAVSSAPGVSSVLLSDDEAVIPAPLPGGALTSSAVGTPDYLSLVPARLDPRSVVGCPE